MVKQYEVTFIVDPVLSTDDIKSTLNAYTDLIAKEGGEVVHINEMGLRQLAFEINRRSSGVYFCVEFKTEGESFVGKLELALKRDERVMRYLTVSLDKYGVKYNADKRAGLIGKKKKEEPKPAPAPVAAPVAVVPPVVVEDIPIEDEE